MGMFRNLFDRNKRNTENITEHQADTKENVEISAESVSGVGLVFVILEDNEKIDEIINLETAQGLYRSLNPELTDSMDSKNLQPKFWYVFRKSIEEVAKFYMDPGYNVIVQVRDIMLPGSGLSNAVEIFAATWTTKPKDGKPAVLLLGESKIIPA